MIKILFHEIFIYFLLFYILCGSLNLSAQESKPMIRNYLQAKAILKKDSPIYESPSTNSRILQQTRQFSFVFVFEPISVQSNYFYYVGKEPNRAIGWIQKSNVFLWDNRNCVKFTPLLDRSPAKVYTTYTDLKSATDKGNSSIQAIAEEPSNTSDVQYAMLIPVLSRRVLNSGNSAFEIAFLSANFFAVKTKEPDKEIDEPCLDILFLIDTTAGMQKYIDGLKLIINKIKISAIKANINFKIGLVCYRDHLVDSHQKYMEYAVRQYSELTKNVDQVIEVVNDVNEAKVSSEDVPEAMFDGLYTAITKSKWTKGSGLRVIILIGDASSHPLYSKKNPMNFSLEKLIVLAGLSLRNNKDLFS